MSIENFFTKIKIKTKNNINEHILENIYNDLIEANEYTRNNLHNYIYSNNGKLNTNNSILFKSIPEPISSHIKNDISLNLYNFITYNFRLFSRNVTIMFAIKNYSNTKTNIQKYNNYIFIMSLWLYIASKYSTTTCNNNLNINIYLSDNIKAIPQDNNIILNQEHANTAFTIRCNEIIIFREEEWFKVFIHETIHNYNLDFSHMNQELCNEKIKKIYNIKSKINLYEAYTEFFARIMNVCIISFINSNNFNNYKKNIEIMINNEIKFSIFQMIKVLNQMNLIYDDFLFNKKKSYEKYKEKTNIFSYFIICAIMMNFCTVFLEWFNINNTNNNIYNFKKNQQKLLMFCNLIKKKYNDEIFLENIYILQNIFFKIKKNKKNINILNNLQMTLYKMKL